MRLREHPVALRNPGDAHFPFVIFHFTFVIPNFPVANPMKNDKWQMIYGKWGVHDARRSRPQIQATRIEIA